MSDVDSRLTEILALLQPLLDEPGLLYEAAPELQLAFLKAAGQLSRPDRAQRRASARAGRRKNKVRRRDADRALLDQTGIRRLRENPIFLTPRRQLDAAPPPSPGRLHRDRDCYICHQPFREVHHFYDQLCPACGDLNYAKRSQTADLTGRVALLTGGRVKIGFQVGMLLLRAGARLVVTTRFPRDAAERYAREPDAAEWSDRLEIHGVDLRRVLDVEALCERLLARLPRLDLIVNNACQTVRRPPGFYDHLMAGERQERTLTDAQQALLAPGPTVTLDGAPAAELSQLALLPEDVVRSEALYPAGRLDADLQQVDLREINSWRLRLAEVSTVELLEVQLVNAVAPFVINARLKPLMSRVATRDTHIVNVSAMEGQFYRHIKGDRHPHTNMAKAALNMMTRTSALDYIEDGIHMNSVDTGWVTDEDPDTLARAKRAMHDFHPPLDIVDGAARILDPPFVGLNTGEHVWGQFLKDYRITDW